MSHWLLYRADPQLKALRDPGRGPFSRCSATLGHEDTLIDMPINPPPPGFAIDQRGMPTLLPPPPPGDGIV